MTRDAVVVVAKSRGWGARLGFLCLSTDQWIRETGAKASWPAFGVYTASIASRALVENRDSFIDLVFEEKRLVSSFLIGRFFAFFVYFGDFPWLQDTVSMVVMCNHQLKKKK